VEGGRSVKAEMRQRAVCNVTRVLGDPWNVQKVQ